MKTLNINLKTALDAIQDGICISDTELKVVFINRAYQDITGLQEKDVLNKSAYQIVSEGLTSNSIVIEAVSYTHLLSVKLAILGKPMPSGSFQGPYCK